MKFSENLKRIRIERGMTQNELAALLHTTGQNYNRYETKDATPPLTVIKNMLSALNVSPNELLGYDKVDYYINYLYKYDVVCKRDGDYIFVNSTRYSEKQFLSRVGQAIEDVEMMLSPIAKDLLSVRLSNKN